MSSHSHPHPLSHLIQLIHSESSSQPITYVLHSTVDPSRKHWKVRLYTFHSTDDSEEQRTEVKEDGVWLYKGYMSLKDITNHLSTRAASSKTTHSSSESTLTSPQDEAAQYLRECILEGKLHIHVEVNDDGDEDDGGGGKADKRSKRRKLNNSEAGTDASRKEISLVLDHIHASPLLLSLRLSSPSIFPNPHPTPSSPEPMKGNKDAQKGLMELCSDMVTRYNAERKEMGLALSQAKVMQVNGPTTPPSRLSQRAKDQPHTSEVDHLKEHVKDLEQQLRFLQRRVPNSPSSAASGSGKLPSEMKPIKPLGGKGVSRLQPTVKAPTKAVMGFIDSDDDD